MPTSYIETDFSNQTNFPSEYTFYPQDPLKTFQSDIIVIVCGNPGVSPLYEEFQKQLYQQTKISTVSISYPGHQTTMMEQTGVNERTMMEQTGVNERTMMEQTGVNGCLFDLDQQIAHKLAFVRKIWKTQRIFRKEDGKDCIDRDMVRRLKDSVRIWMVGHSIGAFMIQEIMKLMSPREKESIQKCFLLYPTVHWIGRSPNAQRTWMKLVIQNEWFWRRLMIETITVLSWIRPTFLRHWTFRKTHGTTEVSDGHIDRILNPNVVENALYLAGKEFETLTDIDEVFYRDHPNQFYFYFGDNDGWVPNDFVDLIDSKLNDCQTIERCSQNSQHAFVLHPKDILVVAKWIGTHLNN